MIHPHKRLQFINDGIGYGCEIAVRDIAAGEQVTDDYGILNIEIPMSCACQQPGCRRHIHPDNVHRLWQQWDRKVKAAPGVLLQVPQPPIELPDTETSRLITHYLQTGIHYQSARMLQYLPSLLYSA